VANALHLLALPREIREDILAGRLTMGHGRAMLALSDPALMLRARDEALARDLSVCQIEALCEAMQASADGTPPKDTGTAPTRQEAAAKLRQALSTNLKILGPTAGGGRIEIAFTDNAQLEHLVQVLLRVQACGEGL
jgi:ParB family chromosome partitioning protein